VFGGVTVSFAANDTISTDVTIMAVRASEAGRTCARSGETRAVCVVEVAMLVVV